MSETFQISPPLSQGVGYGIIVGLGATFAIGMSGVSWFLGRYMNEVQDSEMFMTARHSVKVGLTASAVVSSWTIAATLLTSTTYGYSYGVSGPYWYAAGACVQILLFSVAAIELKRRAPNAQTFLQVAKVRYGTAVHVMFSLYSLVYQLISAVNLLVGGSTVFSVMTGVDRNACCFLFPIGVVIYTLMGGIKATFVTDWVHTMIIYVIMLMSVFVVYSTSDLVGSSDRMWELLREASALHPVSGNAEGSYLTMKSPEGGYVGLVFVGAGFAAAVDSQLFQKAIAADPRSTSAGYILGGLSWFTIPFVLASTYGILAAATEQLPQWPTYPNTMNAYEVSSGMAMPYAALAVMGKGGVVAIMLMVFMAVTSAMSSETVATTALLTYNVYQAYINPTASGRQLIHFSNWVVPIFAIVAAGVAVGFNHAGFSVSFLITAIGIFVDSAIVPMACTIMWRKQSKTAALIAPLASSAAGILAWILKAYTEYGTITITTLSENPPLVAGNMMSLCGPLVLTPLITFLGPEDFDWEILKTQIKSDQPESEVDIQHELENEKILLTARNRSIAMSVFLTLAFLILWPIPMYASEYVFSKGFFKGWVVVIFLWAFFAAGTITLLPVWEARDSIRAFVRLLTGKRVINGDGAPYAGEDGGDDLGDRANTESEKGFSMRVKGEGA
ncbi:putative sodium/proline symporter [Aspergillus heteromorphus CBS 117.55]|uniref:Putative sodium/proline symporter n=1 Tax=Aspergillus heteromorphus CBS 117.55 TaxID=1448321 RepID=A0A317WBW1_9EURO|nr:putative sodium/proline symporter [Aspergillus heteromorphus CBS 117.55]PWY83435.1 putative sodium/proline symporter [Aspergillus heteromorphus CBS 117.55]